MIVKEVIFFSIGVMDFHKKNHIPTEMFHVIGIVLKLFFMILYGLILGFV